MRNLVGGYLCKTDISWYSVSDAESDEISRDELGGYYSRHFPIADKMGVVRNQLVQCL
jgi:hypothetical protein